MGSLFLFCIAAYTPPPCLFKDKCFVCIDCHWRVVLGHLYSTRADSRYRSTACKWVVVMWWMDSVSIFILVQWTKGCACMYCRVLDTPFVHRLKNTCNDEEAFEISSWHIKDDVYYYNLQFALVVAMNDTCRVFPYGCSFASKCS